VISTAASTPQTSRSIAAEIADTTAINRISQL